MKRLFRCAIALLGFGCALILSTPAEANGRYPQAMQLVEDMRDAERLWLRSTYGLLTSSDGGGTWHWICEEALGYSSSAIFDPMMGVHEDGTLIMGLLTGLRTSTNGGCGWKYAIDAIRGNFVVDVAVHPVLKNQGLVLVSFGETDPDASSTSYVNQIWKSADNSKTYTLLSDTLPTNFFSNTLDAAPAGMGGLPRRLYAATPLGRRMFAAWTSGATHLLPELGR